MSPLSQSSLHSMRRPHCSAQCHGRPSSFWIYVFTFGLLCLSQAALVGAAFACPDANCECVSFKDGSNNKLQNITCNGTGFLDFPKDRKEGADVHMLNLRGNEIGAIYDTSLQYFTNLVELDVSYNKITYVTAGAFSSLTILQHLSLEGNDLTLISPALFEIQSLISLNLARNPNISFPDEVKVPGSFTHLDISHSSISNIPTNLLSNLVELKHLDLSHNSITSLPADVFSSNTKLEYINLEGNLLTVAEKSWFDNQDLDHLQQLDLSHNAISAVDKDFIRDLSNLLTLDLSNNEIRDLDKNAFKKQRSLESADLSNNFLTKLDRKLFDDCGNLKILDLSDNSIESLDSDSFDDVNQLLQLDLSNNELTSIAQDLFSSVTGLNFLDLSYNSLRSIPVGVFGGFTGSVVLNITNNPLYCDCDVRNYLYSLKYDSDILLFDEDSIKCVNTTPSTVFLDWYSNTCGGNLGSQGCNSVYDCFSRNSICNGSSCCVCKDSYYDNNGEGVGGGVCKPKVDLGYPCDLDAACLAKNSECIEVPSKVCKCKGGYYDTNKDTHLGGKCEIMVGLGENCTMDSMCAPNNSHCDSISGQCECVSTHYDSTGAEIAGTCLKKLALYEACTVSYQCAPENSECAADACACSSGFYEMDNDGRCQEYSLSFEPEIAQNERFKDLSQAPNYYDVLMSGHIRRRRSEDEGASSFYSCYLDETDGDNKPVEFSVMKIMKTATLCQEYCFTLNKWHTTLKDNYCLCGTTVGSTITGCCPYSSSSAGCTKKTYLPSADLVYVTSGMQLEYIPELTYGVSNLFQVSTTLGVINQIKWNFGDRESEIEVSGASSSYYYFYTRTGKFMLTVCACDQSVPVCDCATVPVIVLAPKVNMTVWITGYQNVDVTKSATDMTATFPEGYDFEYIWSRTDSSNNVIYNMECEAGWFAHRQTCLKLQTGTGVVNTADLKCSLTSSTVLEISYMDEIQEIVSLLALKSTDTVWINAKRENGVWKYMSSNTMTFFTDDNLDDSTVGDYAVMDAGTGGLTSSLSSTKHKIICMKDHVACPHGGSLNSANGQCYIVSTGSLNWQDAKASCISNYNGRLANLMDQATHTLVASEMASTSASEAWFGLNQRALDGSYFWSDDKSYNFNSPPYMASTITSTDEDCFVVTDGSTWTTNDCFSTRAYACEYSVQNARLTVPSNLAGTPDLQVTGNTNLNQIVETTTFTSSATKELTLFPGMWFTRDGTVRYWALQASGVGTSSDELGLLILRPECTLPATIVQPGCENNMFATCSTSNPSCDASDVCDDTESFCYYGGQCKSFAESCTCNSMSSNAACHNYYSSSGAQPNYRVIGRKLVTVDQNAGPYFIIPGDSILVQEGDVLAIENEKGQNVIKCEDNPSSNLQHTSLVADDTRWLAKGDYYPVSSATDKNQTCYFHVIYTQNSVQNLTGYLGNFQSTGSYHLNVTIPYSGVTKSLSVILDEPVEDMKWVFPVIKEHATSSLSLGTAYLEYGVTYNFTVSAGRGTTLKSSWSFDTTISNSFQDSCPSDALLEVPTACDASLLWLANPFSYFSHAITTTGTQEIFIIISNSIDSVNKTVTLKIEKRITSVTFTSTSSVVALNGNADFTTVADGTGLSYAYTVEGISVAGSTDSLTHGFTTAGVFNVSVTVSNILGSGSASLTMTVVILAQFSNCHFESTPIIAAVGVTLTMTFTCDVVTDSIVTATWHLSDRPLDAPLSSTETATLSTTVSWTQSVVFSSASSSVTVNVTYTDQINTGSETTSVTVYEAVPSVSLTPSVTKALINQNVTFTATVSAGNYGTLSYSFEFGNGATDADPSGIVSYFYTNPNTYSVKVIASNGPSQAERTISFEVVQTISGLTVVCDGPTKLGNPTVCTVTILKGTGVEYKFKSEEFDSTVTTNTYSHTFSAEGNYTINITATNSLTEETASVLVYVMAEDEIYVSELTMVGGSFSDCIESGTEHEYSVSVTHFDTTGLVYDWDFDDGITLTGSAAEKHTYTLGKNYSLSLTVKYPAYSATAVVSNTVCIQERINNPMISVDMKIGLPTSGCVTKTASVSLSGTSPVYHWSSNASYSGSTSADKFSLDFCATGFYYISVDVSNEINQESAPTVIVEVMHDIEGVTIDCTSCTDVGGNKYVEKGQSFTVTASVVSGDKVIYSWTYGDSSPGATGTSVVKSYSNVGNYNITVVAQNDVGTEAEYITVHVEERLTSVDLRSYGTNWQTPDAVKDVFTEFKAIAAPSGMEVEYEWEFDTNLAAHVTSDDVAGYNYTSTGEKHCTVTVKNSINSVNKTMAFYVIEPVTDINLKLNSTDVAGLTASVALNKKYILEISANTDVKVTYTMILKKGTLLVQNSKTDTLEYTFDTATTYNLLVSVGNSFGDHTENYVLEVIEEITNPQITVTSGGPSITLGTSISFSASASGTSPEYTWSYKQAPGGEVFPSNNKLKTVTLTPGTVGTYEVVLAVTNDVSSPQIKEYSFEVMEAIGNVSIQSPLIPSDAVKNGTTVTFTADVSAGSSPSYWWTIDSSTGTQQNFSFEFTTQKIYTVSVNVSNLASSIVVSIQIYCLYDVPSFVLSVTGATYIPSISQNVAETGTNLTFASDLTDITYLTFDWLVDMVSSGNGQIYTHKFTTAGSYNIQLDASNKISDDSSQMSVLIQDTIVGFQVSDCMGTFKVDIDVTLTASYSQGSSVAISWERETLGAAAGNSTLVKYTAPGTYTVNATATNYVDIQFVSCQLTIQGIIDNLVLTHSQYPFATYPVSFAISGDNLDAATFLWTISGSSSTTMVPTWDYSFPTEGNYTVTVTVSNFVSSKDVSIVIEVDKLVCAVPVLTVDGSETRTIPRGRAFELGMSISTSPCTAYISVNKWTLYSSASCSGAQTNEYPLPSSVATNTQTLLIPKAILPYGSYCAIYENSFNHTPVGVKANVSVTITESALLAVLVGGDSSVIGAGSELDLDASGSNDPDETPGTTLTYSWACTVSTGFNSVCSAINAITTSTASLTSLTLTSGDLYTISVTVSAPGRTSGVTSMQLEVKEAGSPVVTISCISCKANDHSRVSGVSLQGGCSSGCDDSTTYSWTITTAGGTAVNVDSSKTTTGFDRNILVIAKDGLPSGSDYTFKLEAKTGSKSGSSSVTYSASSPPAHGTCDVTPTSVVPLVDKVRVVCQGWVDSDVTSGLHYRIVVRNYDKPGEEYNLYCGTNDNSTYYISPYPGSTAVYVRVFVSNDYSAETLANTVTVWFTSPSLNAGVTMTTFLLDHIRDNMLAIVKQNNPMLLVEYGIAVLNFLNEQSRIATDDSELSTRRAIRALIMTSLEDLPRETTCAIQQMAGVAQLVTQYPEEIIIQTTLDSLSRLVTSLTDELAAHVEPGLDTSNLQPDSLLSASGNINDAYKFDSSGVTDGTAALFGDVNNYIPAISISSGVSVSYSSDEERMKRNVEDMMRISNRAMIIPLMAKLANEDEVTVSVGTVDIRAQRVTTDNIWPNMNFKGVYIEIPQNVFTHIKYTKKEVFQTVNVAQNTPLPFSYVKDFSISTKVVTAAFTDPDGSEIVVTDLQTDSEIKMYLFDQGSTYYDIQGSLIASPDYDPLQGVQIINEFDVEADKTFELTNIKKVSTLGASIHLQLRVNFQGSGGRLEATLFKDGVAGTDSDGIGPKIITEDMMANKYDHRFYTFFAKPGDSLEETAYKMQVKSNVKGNVTIGIYNSLCQYYDESTSSWAYNGCEATEESVPSCIACKCNHMTSYGGSVILSPDQIDFTDLTRLDIPSNPVAIITCSVILGLYIVVAIVCKKMDYMDVQRISTIPLCGKDGSFKYEVTMVTGRQLGAGTTANVGCRIIGEYGKSASQHLNKKGAFQRNCSDSFIMAFDVNLGELKKVLVWHDNRGSSPSWYLNHVIVKDLQTDKKYYFFSNSWLTLEENKGAIQKELKAAGSADMMRFGRRMKTATFNSLADKHLWFSVLNRPAQSRFTRVQRATCCVTLLYTFIAVNAMWYGLLKKNNSSSSIGDFGWEEVILGLVSNLMVFPINIGIIYLFKKSRSKSNVFEHGIKPQTAETIEIENLCDNSQSGSFQSYGAVPSELDRESTLDSLPPNAAAAGLHRSRPVKSQREATDDTIVKKSVISATSSSAKGPMWNQDSIMKWPEKMPYSEDADSSRPSTSSTAVTNVHQSAGKTPTAARKTSVPGTAESDELLKYLDEMESDLKESEGKSTKTSASRKSSMTRKQSTQTSKWEDLEDILHSDDESTVTDSSKKKLKKKNSTASQTSQDKKFNPREEPRINGNGRWLKSRESNSSTNGSMIGGEHFYYSRGHVSSDAGITAGLKPGYHSEMTMQSQDIPVLPSVKEKCTLPSWCIYIAYVLCFLLCSFSVIVVILYCFKFGYEESLEWVVAFIFSLFQSILLIEPVKAVCIAVYMVLVLKKVEQDEDEDCIDIEPTFDNSSEMIKDVKFKPISGFALMQAKEEGHKMHRMKVMLRQFVAYIFYLWLLMVIVYVNFQYSTYLLTKHVENNFVNTHNNGYVSFNNISSIEDFWEWTENVFADAVHLQDSQTDEEHGYLLGVARMRLIRSKTRTCEASGSASRLGASSLTDRTCYGTTTFEEDTASYGDGWNDSSYNFSWKYSWGKDLGGGHKVGHVDTYGGGGYAHNLGTSLSQTQTLIYDLKSKTWVDLQTRAVVLEFSIYSPGTDMTSLSAMLVEFPLTGGAIPSYEIQTQKLLWFQEGRVDPLMICEVILLLVIIYTLIHIVTSIRDQGKQFFKDFWNWYEMLTTLMTIVAIGMYLGCVVEATNTFNHLLADQSGFTNFERVMYVHVGMRYLHAWLLFLLMFKVVKQLRFVKFMHIYEKTISTAFGQLLAVGLIFIILLLIYAQVGYLMYGHVSGFESVGHSIVTLIVMIRGTFDFWPMLDYQPIFSHFYVYSYYAFTYGLTIALVIAVLNNMYKTNRSQMFYKATLDMQDYEMVDFMMKRFKLWAGIQKEKPAFRRVKFQGLPSISSRSSSSYSSHQTSSSSSHQSSLLTGQEYSRVQLDSMMKRLGPTWLAVVKRFDRIEDLDKEEDNLVKKAESEVKELNFRLRVNGLEKERRELLNWTKTDKSPVDQKQRQSNLKNAASKDTKTDKKLSASVIARRTSETPPSKVEMSQAKGKRPLSDQGARSDVPEKEKSSEPRSLQKFFQQLKPSKPAWNK